MKTARNYSNWSTWIWILLFTFTNGPAYAQDLARNWREDALYLDAATWSRLFPGNPVMPDVANVSDFIAAPASTCDAGLGECSVFRSSCRESAEKIVEQVSVYRDKAARSDSRRANRALREISKVLSDTGGNHPCFSALATVYSVASTVLLDPRTYDTGTRMLGRRGFSVDGNFEVALLLAALANKGKVQFLTSEMRARLGSSWSRKQNGRDYDLRAAYECNSSTIFIDPTLPPLNLASTVIHEMSHFFRDKRLEQWRATHYFPGLDTAQPDAWRAYILLDETLALAQSLHNFRKLHDVFAVHVRQAFRTGLFTIPRKERQITPFVVEGDLIPISENGPFSRLWGLTGPTDAASRFLSAAFLRENTDVRFVYSGDDRLAAREAASIYDVVSRGYFAGSSVAPRTQDALRPEMLSLVLDPLAIWRRDFFNTARYGGSFAGVMTEFDQLLELTRTSSWQCNAYQRAAASGALKNYIGLDYQLPVQAGEGGTRPGEGGTRPTILPCLHSVGEGI